MGIDVYTNIGKPEEKTQVKQNANPLIAAFGVWIQYVEKNAPIKEWYNGKQSVMSRYTADGIDTLVNEATNLLAPHEKNIPQTITVKKDDFFLLRKQKWMRPYIGLFYTAVLNIGDWRMKRTIIVPKEAALGSTWGTSTSYWGYKMQKGVLLSHMDTDTLGYKATGGYIINYGDVFFFGDDSSGGTFINHGYADFFSSEGISINFANPPHFLVRFTYRGRYITCNKDYSTITVNGRSAGERDGFKEYMMKLSKVTKNVVGHERELESLVGYLIHECNIISLVSR